MTWNSGASGQSQRKMSIIEVIKDFEGASIGKYHIKGNKVFASLKEEPIVNKDGLIHNYNWHFVFGLKNNSKDSKEIEIFIECENKNGLQYKANVLGQHNLDQDFHPLNQLEAYTDTYKKYYMKIDLTEKETLYISNTYFRSLQTLESTFGNLCKESCCKKEIYGKSIEGRDLAAFIYSSSKTVENKKPTFLITSGFHPMEADTFASEAIMEYLDSGEGKNLLEYFNFVVIPIVNPDGFYYGYNGCNAKGINLYWDFREKDITNTPETYHLWQYILKTTPSIYIDFHSYTFQLHWKKASPYIKPIYFFRGKEVKKLVEIINKEIISLHNGHYTSNNSTFAPSTLSYKLTKKFNTITYAKYHLHIKNGKEEFQKKAVAIVKKISKCLISKKFQNENKILTHPYGKVRGDFSSLIKRESRIFWIFKIKVFLRKILFKKKVTNKTNYF